MSARRALPARRWPKARGVAARVSISRSMVAMPPDVGSAWVEPLRAGARYAASIWRLRHFWGSLVWMDLEARYRQSLLGLGWSLARPLAMTFVLTIIFSHLFSKPPREYAPFILVGLTCWQFLTESVLNGCHTFARSANYIRQNPLPLAIFPLRTALCAGFHALVALVLAVGLCWALFGFGNVSALPSLIPILAMMLALGWCLALIAGMANTYFPDTQHLLEIGLQLLFYLTPIMYPASLLQQLPLGKWILLLNPCHHLIEAIRLPVLHGTPPSLGIHASLTATLFVACLVAIGSLRWLNRTLVFWV